MMGASEAFWSPPTTAARLQATYSMTEIEFAIRGELRDGQFTPRGGGLAFCLDSAARTRFWLRPGNSPLASPSPANVELKMYRLEGV